MDSAVVAEAFEAATLLFHFSELSIHPDTSVGSTGFCVSVKCSQGVA